MAGTGHKSVARGCTALVRLRDGTVLIDKFLEDRDRYLVFAEHGRIASDRIATVTPYRPVEGSQWRGEAQRITCVLCTNTYQAREAAKMLHVAGRAICRGCARAIAEQLRES